ncbi:hypothetical protein DDZ13_14265 [Coraliomargarita sinensis]|uniref:DUF1573 domain-containing protein n=1 Tax=Coraliomargarita sinensis TaxID=2174842 RepID=A0A317ZG86_9BACT|nr:DUF1573 domain-containing protein [Coraliomargarita sinensis]PXA02948.1 hypothetical protein DDZ13_14265 [Coraliomargarita sinensis]
MRLSIILPALCLCLVHMLSASDLSWDRTEVKLEMKPDQKEVRASFKVTNKGEDRIRISRIKTSCGCTGSIIDRKILKPGDTTEIIATFNKGKRQGLNRLQLDVFIDSQAEAVATLRMNVEIPELVEATPRVVYWSPSGSKSERRVTVTLDERYVDSIQSIGYDSDKLNVVEEKAPGDNASRTLRITPKSYDELYRGTVVVKAKRKDGRSAETQILTLVQP